MEYIPPPDVTTRCPSLSFTLSSHVSTFGPRAGCITLTRDDHGNRPSEPSGHHTTAHTITMDTPNILIGTSRGVVPHFSRDHTNGSEAIHWINIPFESFLEQDPPVPTLQNGSNPLHRFLGFDADRHIVSLCLRNPLDTREMPPNGNTYVSADCVRGVKKVTLSDWRKYVYKMQPDIVFALTDTPLTPPPYSQKRITKSIERSAAWVVDILRPLPGDAGPLNPDAPPLNVFVHMAGGTSIAAREAFAYGLQEMLHGPEADAVKPFRSLDEGVSGYVFDLAALRGTTPGPNMSQHQSLPDSFLRLEHSEILQQPEPLVDATAPSVTGEVSIMIPSVLSETEAGVLQDVDIVPLLQASLRELPEQKPRLATGVRSPHEMLRLIRDVGIDLFDVAWAMVAANIGVALDFVFPAPETSDMINGRRQLGHNLYDPIYAHQFRRLADTFGGRGESADQGMTESRLHICPCIACSPPSSSSHILHSAVDHQSYNTASKVTVSYGKPFSRAYIHHLLHTHEMSAHALLVAHNLAVTSAFLAGVRRVWVEGGDENRSVQFALEANRFVSAYDESGRLFGAAKKGWECVDRARGKGRLAREREKQEDPTL